MNICLCGSQAGYPHNEDCPYPLYRGSDQQLAEWQALFEANQTARVEAKGPTLTIPAYEAETWKPWARRPLSGR